MSADLTVALITVALAAAGTLAALAGVVAAVLHRADGASPYTAPYAPAVALDGGSAAGHGGSLSGVGKRDNAGGPVDEVLIAAVVADVRQAPPQPVQRPAAQGVSSTPEQSSAHQAQPPSTAVTPGPRKDHRAGVAAPDEHGEGEDGGVGARSRSQASMPSQAPGAPSYR